MIVAVDAFEQQRLAVDQQPAALDFHLAEADQVTARFVADSQGVISVSR